MTVELDLLQRIRSHTPSVILEAIAESTSRGDEVLLSALHEVLATTDDAVVRNSIALALSDIHDAPAWARLVALLESPRTAGARGTLLYAMGAYDCAPVLPLLITSVVDGTFEESRQAFALIEGIETELSAQTWSACRARVHSAMADATEERRPLLERLVAMLEA